MCACRYTYIRNSLCRIITISIKGCIQFFVVPRFHEKETARAGCQQVEAVQSKEEGNGRAEGYSAPGRRIGHASVRVCRTGKKVYMTL